VGDSFLEELPSLGFLFSPLKFLVADSTSRSTPSVFTHPQIFHNSRYYVVLEQLVKGLLGVVGGVLKPVGDVFPLWKGRTYLQIRVSTIMTQRGL
jgi:hypothetical protein